MKDGLLDEIIHLEKQLQDEVAVEEARAATWRDRELASLAEAKTRADAAEEEHRRQAMATADETARREAEELESRVTALCLRLENLADETLLRVLQRHLPTLLPGSDHDHPHGEG